MFRRFFRRNSPPRFSYQRLIAEIATALPAFPGRWILFCDHPLDRSDRLRLKPGDRVATGGKLVPFIDSPAYVIAPATGVITAIEPFLGDFGRRLTRIDLRTDGPETIDPGFTEAAAEVSIETLRAWAGDLPGGLDPTALTPPDQPIETLLVSAVEADLLSVSAQYVLKTRTDAVRQGIEILRQVTGAKRVILAVGRESFQGLGGHLHAEIRAVSGIYPASAPALMVKELLGRQVPAGAPLAKLGLAVVSVEAAASLGRSFAEKRLALEKIVTVVDRDGRRSLVTVRVGTPVAEIFEALGIRLGAGDRLIAGGPMAGACLFTDDHPVRPDTHCLLVQDPAAVTHCSSDPCINCGECVRICPTHVPINMLVRLLETGKYDIAADEYDLWSCVDCGLCSYVCPARIPIFQYIRLAKHELALRQVAETENV